MGHKVSGKFGLQNKLSLTVNLEVSFKCGTDLFFNLKKLKLVLGRSPTQAMSTLCRLKKFNWGTDQELNNKFSRRRTMKDARNSHYGTCSSIQFQDGPETYSNLISSGALNIN